VFGVNAPSTPQTFSPTDPTTISPRSRSIASTTALPTSSAVRAAEPGGAAMPESANSPAPRMKPGVTTETPTPASRRSWRSPHANPRRPNFVAAYTAELPVAIFPASDDMNTMCPAPRATMGSDSVRARMIGARRFTSSARSSCSPVYSSTGPSAGIPALATRMSTSPASLASRSTAARSLRSAAIARPPTSSASGSSTSVRRPLSTSFAPRPASARAIALPSPPVAPVTSTVLPATFTAGRLPQWP
jgi:hypothetical protein